MLEFAFNDNARSRSEEAVMDQLSRMLHDRALAGAGPLTKKDLFAAHCNDAPVIGSIVDAALVELRAVKDIVIRSPQGALRRSVSHFTWDDEVSLSREPGLFSIFDQQAA
jgi:hypothetical protein